MRYAVPSLCLAFCLVPAACSFASSPTPESLAQAHLDAGYALDTAYFDAGHLVDIAACDLREMTRQGKALPAGLLAEVEAADASLRGMWLSLEARREAFEELLRGLPSGRQRLRVETLDPSADQYSGWFMLRSARLVWPDGSEVEIPLTRFVGGKGPERYDYQCEPSTAVWIYGTNTEHPAMEAGFDIPEAATGDPRLLLSGQEHDKPGPVRIRISLNGKTLLEGDSGFVKQGWSEREVETPATALSPGGPEPALLQAAAMVRALASDIQDFAGQSCRLAAEIRAKAEPITSGLVWSRPAYEPEFWSRGFLRGVYFDAIYVRRKDPARAGREAEWAIKMARDMGFDFLSGYFRTYAGEAWMGRFLEWTDALGIPCVEAWWGGYPYTEPEAFSSGVREYVAKWAKHPSLIGIGVDEPTINSEKVNTEAGRAGFRSYLASRAIQLRGAGIELPEAPGPISMITSDNDRALWAEWQFYLTASMRRFFRDQWNRLYPDGIFMYPVIMAWPFTGEPQMNSISAMGNALPLLSTDVYNNAYFTSSFYMQLIRNATRGRAHFVPGSGYSCKTPARFQRDLAVAMVHGEGVCMWTWLYFDKYRDGDVYFRSTTDDRGHPIRSDWRPEYWDLTRDMYARMRRAEPYLFGAKSEAPVVLLVSERTAILDSAPDREQGAGYPKNSLGAYAALLRRGQPFDARLLETTTLGQLRRYRVSVLVDARALTSQQVAMLAEWVRQGGTLIACGEVGVEDEWGRKLTDFALADVLGASYAGSRPGGRRLTIAAGALPTVGGISLRQEPQRGFVGVKPTTARVLAHWDTGEPGLVFNECEKGRVYLATARGLGLYTTGFERSWEYPEQPGTGLPPEDEPDRPALLRALVDAALADDSPPVSVMGAPLGVEVQLRRADDAWVVHLLDWVDEREVSGVKLSLGSARAFEVSYPADDSPNAMRVKSSSTLEVRPFRGYQMVAVRPLRQPSPARPAASNRPASPSPAPIGQPRASACPGGRTQALARLCCGRSPEGRNTPGATARALRCRQLPFRPDQGHGR